MKVLNSRLPSLDLVSRRKITPFFASNRYWTEIFYTFLDPCCPHFETAITSLNSIVWAFFLKNKNPEKQSVTSS